MKNVSRVRHSGCGSYFQVKEPLDLTRWRTHPKECKTKAPKKAGGTRTLLGMWKVTKSTSQAQDQILPPTELKQQRPCPGITEADNKRTPQYLYRSNALGGGGRDISIIAKEKFNSLFRNLSKKQKDEVLDWQQQGHKWRNDHKRHRIFSMTCQRLVPDLAPNRPLPCASCNKVLDSKQFKNALRKPVPLSENLIYTNGLNQNKEFGKLYKRYTGLKDILENPVSLLSTTSVL